MDQQIDINILVEAFKTRLAQLEYELLLSNTLVTQMQQQLKELNDKVDTNV